MEGKQKMLDSLILSLDVRRGITRMEVRDFFFFLGTGYSHRALLDASGPPGDGGLSHASFKRGLLPAEERPVAAT